jgi:hypothetical protein
VAEHPEVARVEVKGSEALREAPMPMRTELDQQEAGTAAQPRRGRCLRAGGISRHLLMIDR